MECLEIGYPPLVIGFSLLNALSRETINHLLRGWKTKKLYEKTPFRYNRVVQALLQRKGVKMANKSNDLANTKWMCKYHIVFTPKYR